MGLTGNSRERQFSLPAGAARLHRFVEQNVGDSLLSGCFTFIKKPLALTVRSAKRYIDGVILPDAHDSARERGRLGVVIATIVINVIAVSPLTFAP